MSNNIHNGIIRSIQKLYINIDIKTHIKQHIFHTISHNKLISSKNYLLQERPKAPKLYGKIPKTKEICFEVRNQLETP